MNFPANLSAVMSIIMARDVNNLDLIRHQRLAVVYRFKGENTVYWIYSFKLGSYYPFVPSDNGHVTGVQTEVGDG